MKTKNRGFSGKVKLRFKRGWRNYRPGDEITPPAALREELLRQKDALGKPIAEVVEEKAEGAPAAVEEADKERDATAPTQEAEQAEDETASKPKRKAKKDAK